MASTSSDIQALYVAFYGRPADPVGLSYWVRFLDSQSAALGAIASAFGQTPEFISNFSGLSNSGIVTKIYQNLFNRQIDVSGLAFWSSKLDSGTLSLSQVTLSILQGVVRDSADDIAIKSKIAAAEAFTTALDTSAEVYSYNQTAAFSVGKTWLETIYNAETKEAATAPNALNTTVLEMVNAANTVPGRTYTLTKGLDAIVGTAGNDIFNAPNGDELSTFVLVDGGAGADVLNVLAAGAFNAPKTFFVKKIETANITGAQGVVVDTREWTGLTKLTVNTTSGVDTVTASATTAVTVNNKAGAVTVHGGSTVAVNADTATTVVVATAVGTKSVTVSGGTSIAINDNNRVADTISKVDIARASGAATISSDALTALSLNGMAFNTTVTAAPATRTLAVNLVGHFGGVITDATATTLSLNASGTWSAVDDLFFGSAKSISVSGDTALTLKNTHWGAATSLSVNSSGLTAILGLSTTDKLSSVVVEGSGGLFADFISQTALKLIDASKSTGANTVGVNSFEAGYLGGSGVDTVTLCIEPAYTISMGAGNDVLTITPLGIDARAEIDGGSGTDTLKIRSDLTSTGTLSVKGFEVLTIESLGSGHTMEASGFVGLKTIHVSGTGSTFKITESASMRTTMEGNSEAQSLTTGVGSDVLIGKGGKDTLTGGGGDDVFRYTSASDSTVAAPDTITDFSQGDSIDFVGMAGISLLSRPYTYTTSVAATVSAIVGDTAVSQSQVFFTDGTDGYVYIKGAGTGTSYDGTLIKLLALKTLPTSVIKGTVIDGYIAGATLYVDVNGNGIADATESTGIKTDANGNFSLETTMVGPLIAVGGTNVDTGLPNSLTLSAPRGSTVITPITSLVQGLVSGTGATIAEAEELVQSKLGIQGAVDLTQFDALKAGSDPTIALKVQQTAAQLAELGTLAEGAGSDFAKVITAIGDAINSNQTINLVGRESLDTVLGKVLNTSQLDKAISITQDIAATTSTQSISTVQLRVSNNNVGAGGVSISGTPTQGQALNATNTLTDADGLGAISYQWNADGIAVPLATGATFLPEQPQVGKVITVTASYVDGKGNTEAFTSAATTKVVNVNDAPTGSITIQGTAAELQVLTAVSTLADLDGLGTLSYQWLRADNPIANATASTYILQQSDVGSAVRVRISYTDGLSAVESVTSSPTASIAGVSKTLLGTTNNDSFTGGLGDDTIDGGAGIDTANYIGSRTNFTLLKAAANFVAADLSGKEGTDTLTSIERINFADKKLALDLAPTQHAGQTVLLLGLLSPSTLLSPAIVGGVLALFDSGLTLRDVCQLALDAGVVSNIAGSSSNLDLATLAAKNLTGVTEAATVDLLLSFLDGRNAALSQTDFLTIGASLDINQLQVNLVGLQSTGIDFS